MKTLTTFEGIKVPHGITTKHGGVSHGYFGPMNTAFYGADRYNDVLENLSRLLKWLNKPVKAIIATRQVHGTDICCVDDERTWDAFEKFDTKGTALEGIALYAVPNCDGLITSRDDVLLLTYYADCVPVMMWSPEHHCVGVAHSGWRGTYQQISKSLVEALQNQYAVQADTLKVGIGHAAGGCCYEVGEDVHMAFLEIFSKDVVGTFMTPKGAKYLIDLKKAIALQLLNCGLSNTQIEIEPDCTLCAKIGDEWVYHSHRRDGLKRGSMSAAIGL